MAKVDEIVVRISFKFWVQPYLAGVELASTITGLDPDPEKVMYWLSRGIKIDLVSGSRKSP